MAITRTNEFTVDSFQLMPLPTPRELGAVLIRQRSVILGTSIVVGLVMWFAGMWTPTYVAHMKILVVRQRVDAIISPEVNSPIQWGGDQVSEEDLNSEVELLKSTDLLRKVVVATGLNHDHSLASQRNPDK